jgi:hypothetical protein
MQSVVQARKKGKENEDRMSGRERERERERRMKRVRSAAEFNEFYVVLD